MAEEVKHYQIEQRYRFVIERAAVKGIDGFKVEANGDLIDLVELDAQTLYNKAKEMTKQEEIK